jgi:parallel beta-helix repeat protein
MKNILFIILFAGCSLSWAATYYVDYSNGLNTNNGISPASAWKNCPGDASATGVPASAQIVPGDKILFKGGVIYKGETSVRWSGSVSSQIIYDGNSAGTFGAGKALIDGENVRSYGFSALSGTTNYVTIKNFEIWNMKYTGVPWQGGAAIKIDDASYVTIADCYLHDVGYWHNDGSIIPAGNGVHMLRPKNCLISGCEITRTGLAGIEVDGSVNCTFSHNNIHDYITWGIDIGGDFNLCTGNIVSDNTIHDMYQYDEGYWGIPNDPNIPHTDYIFLRQGGGQHPIYNVIERNLFYNNQVFDEFGGTAMLFLSFADSTIIRNNIFINPHGYYATRFSWTSSGTKFYNNTIYAPNLIAGGNGVGGIFLETNGNTDIRNNIIVTYQSSLAYTAIIDETGLNSDYNLFYNVTSSQDFVRITPSRYATFAVWKTFGYDTHSLKAASVADIKFTNVAGYPVSCQTMDLRILATSPAVNAGVTLSGFANDMNSTVRPQGIAWDIGAYEAIITVMPVITTQPVNMAVTAGQTATFLIAASGTAPLAYQWQRSNDNGTTWNTVSGATSATYTTPATVTSDNGAKFRCLATNTAGSATSNAGTLTVNTVSKLSGTAFGTTPSQAPGYEYNKASDNDSNTYFEYALNNGGYTGIDLGSGNACKIAKIRFHSHPGFEFRMAGGKFQGSTTSSSSGYVDLYTIPATPPAGWNEIQTTDQNSYRYLRFFSAANVYCTIAEMEFYRAPLIVPVITTQPVNMAVTAGQTATFLIAASGTAPLAYQWQRSNDNGTTWNTVSGATSATYTTPATVTSDNGAKFRCLATNTAGSATSNAGTLTVNTVSKLSGTAFGTTPSQAPGYEYNKASDNDSNTYFEYALNNGGYTGIDLGSGNAGKIAKIRFHSHPGFEFRMAGGKFQGSTTSSSSGYVDLYTIPATPPAGWNEIQTTDQNSYRYLRFFSAVNVYCTIAEMEFYGTISNPLSKKTAVSGGTPMRALPKEFSLSPVMNSRNPSSVQVIFAAPVALSEVRFDLFNLQGRCIETVVRHGSQPGYSSIEFSNSGSKLTAGNYLCRVHSQGFEKTIKLLVR